MAAKGWYWPVAIVGLLVGGAAANIGFMIVANRDATFAVEPDYYRKAVDWDRAMAQEARNVELGWRADGAVVTEPTDLRIAIGHKGFAWFEIETRGRAAHGSRFQEGVAERVLGLPKEPGPR